MVGVLLLYVAPWVAEHVRGVATRIVTTGFGSDSLGVKAGNKGGVACRLDAFGASVCVINSHLPAGQSHPEERNATYSEVLAGLEKGFASARGGPHPPPLAHDLCVWLGDLNYRIDQPNELVRRRIAAGEAASLLPADQLKQAQGAGLAFEEFREAPVHFPPTYKYDAGTNAYDTSEKARTPSWTDRVLWRAREAGAVEPRAYTCSQAVMISDHKPWRPT